MAQKIQRFNIYGPADKCDDGQLCNWSDVEPCMSLLGKIKLVVDEHGSCEIKKDDKFYMGINAVLAQKQRGKSGKN